MLNDFLRAKKNDALVSDKSCFARQRLRLAALASLAPPPTAELASLAIPGLRHSAPPPAIFDHLSNVSGHLRRGGRSGRRQAGRRAKTAIIHWYYCYFLQNHQYSMGIIAISSHLWPSAPRRPARPAAGGLSRKTLEVMGTPGAASRRLAGVS